MPLIAHLIDLLLEFSRGHCVVMAVVLCRPAAVEVRWLCSGAVLPGAASGDVVFDVDLRRGRRRSEEEEMRSGGVLVIMCIEQTGTGVLEDRLVCSKRSWLLSTWQRRLRFERDQSARLPSFPFAKRWRLLGYGDVIVSAQSTLRGALCRPSLSQYLTAQCGSLSETAHYGLEDA